MINRSEQGHDKHVNKKAVMSESFKYNRVSTHRENFVNQWISKVLKNHGELYEFQNVLYVNCVQNRKHYSVHRSRMHTSITPVVAQPIGWILFLWLVKIQALDRCHIQDVKESIGVKSIYIFRPLDRSFWDVSLFSGGENFKL